MELDDLVLSDTAKLSCERWLQSWNFCSRHMVKDKFSPNQIRVLLKYELSTRKRKLVIDRLITRYYMLLKKETREKIYKDIRKDS